MSTHSVKVLYFAALRDALNTAEETLETTAKTVEELMHELAQRGDNWSAHLLENRRLRVSVNQELSRKSTHLQSGDEVAFFPPVTGG